MTDIPRADVTGVVSSDITLSESGVFTKFEVGVSITHPEVSHLKVELISPSNQIYILHDGPNSNVSGVDLNVVYPSEASPIDALDPILGTAVSGTWRLRLSDTDIDPRGGALRQLTSWSITYEREELMMLGDSTQTLLLRVM